MALRMPRDFHHGLPDCASPPSRHTPPMTTLVFDFGLKAIGVAAAERRVHLARGLTTIAARDGVPRWNDLDSLIAEWRPALLVVGLPLNMDGTASAMCALAEGFGDALTARYALPVEYADERLSTFEAKHRGADAATRHATAAEVIAETWLGQNQCRRCRSGPAHVPRRC